MRFFVFIYICVCTSCNNQSQSSNNSETNANANSVLNCYLYVNNKDTVLLKTINKNGAITGTLVYNFFEKDENQGTIQGHMNEDMLIADYTFGSEGVTSVRQVVFKKSGNNFVEGYGDSEDDHGKTIFKKPDSLDFSHSIVLKKVDCGK